MPQIAKVFNSGNSQAVRLPKEFRLNVEEVEISREGAADPLGTAGHDVDHIALILSGRPDHLDAVDLRRGPRWPKWLT